MWELSQTDIGSAYMKTISDHSEHFQMKCKGGGKLEHYLALGNYWRLQTLTIVTFSKPPVNEMLCKQSG